MKRLDLFTIFKFLRALIDTFTMTSLLGILHPNSPPMEQLIPLQELNEFLHGAQLQNLPRVNIQLALSYFIFGHQTEIFVAQFLVSVSWLIIQFFSPHLSILKITSPSNGVPLRLSTIRQLVRPRRA